MRQFLKYLAIGLAVAAEPAMGATDVRPAGLSSGPLLNHLSEAIRWHRQVQSSRTWIAQPIDEFFWSNQRNLANQVIEFAFTAAQAELPLVAPDAPKKKTGTATPDSTHREKIANMADARADRVRQLQADIEDIDDQIRSASSVAARAPLIAQRDALQAQLEWFKGMAELLQKIGDVMDNSAGDNGTATLAGQIEALQRSVPDAFGASASANPALSVMSVDSGGLIKRTLSLFALGRSLRAMNDFAQETEQLQATVAKIQLPLRSVGKDLVQQGDKAVELLAGADPGQQDAMRQKLEILSAQFKRFSAVVIPLREEAALLDQSRNNLQQWHDSINGLYHKIVWALVARAVTVLAMLGSVFVISEVWQRLTYRYVHDDRRRRQFLLIRRLVTGVLMIAAVVLGFISDFSSLATFTGVLMAGIAVALQTIILSIAAYFFLIGRSGLRAGDRITIAGVTGDVMQVGPVRFYVKELAGTGDDLQPTGRMAIFSNSVIFQHNPVFRPMPKDTHP